MGRVIDGELFSFGTADNVNYKTLEVRAILLNDDADEFKKQSQKGEDKIGIGWIDADGDGFVTVGVDRYVELPHVTEIEDFFPHEWQRYGMEDSGRLEGSYVTQLVDTNFWERYHSGLEQFVSASFGASWALSGFVTDPKQKINHRCFRSSFNSDHVDGVGFDSRTQSLPGVEKESLLSCQIYPWPDGFSESLLVVQWGMIDRATRESRTSRFIFDEASPDASVAAGLIEYLRDKYLQFDPEECEIDEPVR